MQGNPQVIANFRQALPLEAQLNIQYRMDLQLIKFLGAKKLAGKFHKFGDDAHDWMKAVTKQILFLTGDRATEGYQMGPIVEPPTLTALFEDSLSREARICDLYETFIPVAMNALDDQSRNLWEHLIKWHRTHQLWLEQQLAIITALNEREYLAEKL